MCSKNIGPLYVACLVELVIGIVFTRVTGKSFTVLLLFFFVVVVVVFDENKGHYLKQ